MEVNTEELENTEEQEAPEEESNEEPSLRDVLNDAIESSEDTEEGDTPKEKDEEAPAEEEKAAEGEEKPRGDKDSLPAPESWNPKARELWTKIPPDMQKLIRESEDKNLQILQETAEARKTHEFINQIATSYAPVMAAEGVNDPKVGIQGLFDTVALLQNGSQVAKAQRIAQMISHYGIDIQALDSALAGEQPQNSEASQVEQIIEQKFQPFNQLLSELQNRKVQTEQMAQAEAQKEIEQFQGEFLNDVRNDMADIIDAAVLKGQEMSLQRAYDIAVSLRPDLKEILDQRQQQEALIGSRNKLARKQNAASSITGSRGGMAGGADTLRSAIEDAWDGV